MTPRSVVSGTGLLSRKHRNGRDGAIPGLRMIHPRNSATFAKRFLFCFVVMLFFAGTSLLRADFLEDQIKAMESYDIYDSLAKSEWPVPSPRMSNRDLYRISEYVVGQGYQYFSVSPKLPKSGLGLRPDMWQFFLEGKEVVILAYDAIPKKSKWYVWDARKIYRRARNRLGYRGEREKALREIDEELKRNPGDISVLSRKAGILSERARYERKGVTDYFDALKQLILARMKRGDILDLDTDLNPFMEVAVCADRESEYLDALTLMPAGQVETRKLARKRYDNKQLLFIDPDEKKELCRVYGSFDDSKKK
ncbi:MAG: hypothetical protein ABH891_06785 [Candidatus Omnitrophota bacterium]